MWILEKRALRGTCVLVVSLAMFACGPKPDVAEPSAPGHVSLNVGEGTTFTSGVELDRCYREAYALLVDKPLRLVWFNRFRAFDGPIQGQRIAKFNKKDSGVWEYQTLDAGAWTLRKLATYKNGVASELVVNADGTTTVESSTKVDSCTKLSRGGYQISEHIDGSLPLGKGGEAWTMSMLTGIDVASYRGVAVGRPLDQPNAPLEWMGTVVAVPETEGAPSVQTLKSLNTALANYKAVNDLDVDAIEALLAPEAVAVSVHPTDGLVEKSRADYVEGLKRILSLAPKNSATAVVSLANGDRSASIYIVDYEGPRVMFGETGVHNDEGKLVRIVDYGDMLTTFNQAGIRSDSDSADPEKPWPKTFQIAATGSAEEAANVEVVKALFAADAAGDSAATTAFFAEGAVLRNVPSKPIYSDLATHAALIADRHKTFEPSYDIQSMWGAGDWVVGEYLQTLRFKEGKNAGKEMTTQELAFAQLSGGKITRLYFIYNSAPTKIQLGLLTKKQFDADMAKFREWIVARAKKR